LILQFSAHLESVKKIDRLTDILYKRLSTQRTMLQKIDKKKCPLNKSTDFIFIFRQSAGRGTERFIRVARGHGDLNPQICLANTCFFHLD
jgi:hypothetical protein